MINNVFDEFFTEYRAYKILISNNEMTIEVLIGDSGSALRLNDKNVRLRTINFQSR